MLKQHLSKATWLLSRLFPTLLGRWAAKQFQIPGRPRELTQQLDEPDYVWHKHEVTIRRWGKQGPIAVLLHGWAGHHSQFHALAKHLLGDGYSVVIVTPPGHGTTLGIRASPTHFSTALHIASETVGKFDLLIGHSMGGLASFIAINTGLIIPKVISISAPSELSSSIDAVAKWLRLSKYSRSIMRQRIENFADMPIGDIDATTLMTNFTGELLIIHDQSDRKISAQHASKIQSAILNAEIIYTKGLGHTRILQDPDVHRQISVFGALVRVT